MRRSSVITIILLVLVIIGLIVALVVTNLPEEKDETSSNTVVQESSDGSNGQATEEEEETPTYVALDSDIAKDMYKRLNANDSFFFHYFKKGVLTQDDFTNEEKQVIAYYYSVEDKLEELLDSEKDDSPRAKKFQVKYMDEAMMSVFGNTDYEPTYGYFQTTEKTSEPAHLFEYDATNNVYYVNGGWGGAPDGETYTAIAKIEEYSDRYEVTEELLIGFRTYGDEAKRNIYSYFGARAFHSDIIEYSVSEDDILAGTNSKGVVSYSNGEHYTYNDYVEKMISKYYDYATEYKHTFMKNSDGTYYWVKTEIVK